MNTDDPTLPAEPFGPDDAEATPIGLGSKLGRFEVVAELGAGGMGVVYSAIDPDLRRRVAVKLLRAGNIGTLHATEASRRLVREAQAMAKLSHPNVMPVFEVGQHGDQVFVVMELIEGGTANEWLRRAPRSWRDIIGIFAAAGRGLAAAHKAGFVHRDFKPDNLLIDRDDRVRVTDFGLVGTVTDGAMGMPEAAELDPDADVTLTHTGALLGTPPYMAPEQHQGAEIDERTDQFSYCVTLYEALYGERPFAGATYRELLKSVTTGSMRDAPSNADVPVWLRRVLTRGLSVDPAQRFASMNDLLAAIDDGLDSPARSPWPLIVAVGVGFAAIAAVVVAIAVSRSGATPSAPLEPSDDAAAVREPLAIEAPEQLTRTGACAYSPAFADDATIAFDLTTASTAELYMVSAQGGDVTQLTDTAVSEWRAAQGRRPGEIVYLVQDHSRGEGIEQMSLAFFDLATRTSEPIADVHTPTAVVANGDIYYGRVDGAEIRRLHGGRDELVVSLPPDKMAFTVTASADGSRLAFLTDPERASPTVCLVDLTATKPTFECPETIGALTGRAALSPAGDVLYYAADVGIRRLDIATGEDHELVPGALAPGGVAVSPDGATLVFSDCTARARLLDIDADPPRQLGDGPIADPIGGPDGRIAYVRQSPGAHVLVVREPDGALRDITSPALGNPAMPAFDSRGQRIAFKLNGGEPGLYVVDTTPYPPERVTDGTLDTSPVWTADDELAFTRWDEAHKPTVMLLSLAGGEPRVAHPKQRITVDANRVTGELLLMSVEYTRLYLWNPSTGEERAISTDALDGGHLLRASGSADGRWVLVQSGPWGETTWRLSVDGTTPPERIYHAGDGTTMERPLMLADGRVIVVPEVWVGELYRASLR